MGVVIAYPTAAEMRTLGKWMHGTPAERIARCYVIPVCSDCGKQLDLDDEGDYVHIDDAPTARSESMAHKCPADYLGAGGCTCEPRVAQVVGS